MGNREQNVLILDDEEHTLKEFTTILKPHYKILASRDGSQALEQVMGKGRPDIVLLNPMLPGLDGHGILKQLKLNSKTRHIPVLFVIDAAWTEYEKPGIPFTADDYIRPPFHPAVVRARVKAHVDLKRKGELLHKVGSLDPLTELANRNRFDEIYALEWRRANRVRKPLSLILVEIDFFEDYRRIYGGEAGDECLRAVAQAIAKSVKRPGDFSACYDDGMFALVLAETLVEGAAKVADQILKNVEKMSLPFKRPMAEGRVSVSMGVVATVPKPDKTPPDLIRTASAMLKEAQQGGRNGWKSTHLK